MNTDKKGGGGGLQEKEGNVDQKNCYLNTDRDLQPSIWILGYGIYCFTFWENMSPY